MDRHDVPDRQLDALLERLDAIVERLDRIDQRLEQADGFHQVRRRAG